MVSNLEELGRRDSHLLDRAHGHVPALIWPVCETRRVRYERAYHPTMREAWRAKRSSFAGRIMRPLVPEPL